MLKDVLRTFFAAVEDNYSRIDEQISFHNSLHAADVMHSVSVLLDSQSIRHSFTPLEVRPCASLLTAQIAAILIAAAVHDIDHPGHSNRFLVCDGASRVHPL